MFTFKALIDITAFEAFFAHGITTLGTLFVYRLKVGDEFTFRVVRTPKELASFALSLLECPPTFRTGNRQFFRWLKGLCIFAFGVRGAGQELASS